MTATPATDPRLHRFLGIGLVTLAVAFVVVRRLGFTVMPQQDSVTTGMAYAFSGFGVVLAALALVVFKPRVPNRPPGQSIEQYWSRPEVGANVAPVWLLLEAGGTIAAVGYLITGELVSAIATGLAIVAFWFSGPNAFARP